MKSISITANNRPELLKRVVDSILDNNLDGFTHCFCAVEPGFVNDNHKELLRLEDRFEYFDCVFNKTKLGVRKNPYNLLSQVFSPKHDIDFNLYLEDDSLLSPDAFDFVRFYLDNYKSEKILCCNLYNYKSNPSLQTNTGEVFDFCALGFGLNRNQWFEWFQPYWFDERIRIANGVDLNGKGGWDWSIRAVMKGYNLRVIAPSLSRSYHLGVIGEHCDKSCYDNMFKNHPYSNLRDTKFQI